MGSCNILSVYKSLFRTCQPEHPFPPGSLPGAGGSATVSSAGAGDGLGSCRENGEKGGFIAPKIS